MMNVKKAILTVTVLGALCAGSVFAKEAPSPVAPLDLTPQQWEQLKTLKPHQQNMAIHKGIQQQMMKDKMAKLNETQKAEVEQFIQDEHNHRKAMMERFKKMNPEQKEIVKMKCFPKHNPMMKGHKNFKKMHGMHNGKHKGSHDFHPFPGIMPLPETAE